MRPNISSISIWIQRLCCYSSLVDSFFLSWHAHFTSDILFTSKLGLSRYFIVCSLCSSFIYYFLGSFLRTSQLSWSVRCLSMLLK
ncbi:hypothetical protein GW17_00057543 [Ensete ventricosum]|nr:hypothetical protein GW17_00057543 [Ensete ventricosum]